MGDQPTTVNKPAQTVDAIINAVIFDGAVVAAEAALKSAVPFLNLPVVSQILDFLVRYLGRYIYLGLSQFATFQIINIQTNAEKSAYVAAELKLRHAHLSGDPALLSQAQAEFKMAFRRLVFYDGSA